MLKDRWTKCIELDGDYIDVIFLLILQRFVLDRFWPIFFTECDWILKERLNIFQPSVNLFIYVEKCVHISIRNDDFEIIRYLANDGSIACDKKIF